LSDSVASDESLLESAGEGDPKAFEQLLQRYQAWAWRIAYRFPGQREGAARAGEPAFPKEDRSE